MARWLRELPATSRVSAVVDALDQRAVRPLSTQANAAISWVVRKHEADFDSVLGAVRALNLPQLQWAWVAGEANMVQAVRRLLLVEMQIPAAAITARGYWKCGAVDHQEPHED
jgi:NADPH-dependent ferric siderophore reductase